MFAHNHSKVATQKFGSHFLPICSFCVMPFCHLGSPYTVCYTICVNSVEVTRKACLVGIGMHEGSLLCAPWLIGGQGMQILNKLSTWTTATLFGISKQDTQSPRRWWGMLISVSANCKFNTGPDLSVHASVHVRLVKRPSGFNTFLSCLCWSKTVVLQIHSQVFPFFFEWCGLTEFIASHSSKVCLCAIFQFITAL